MRVVISAMRRSLTSVASVSASASDGARRTSRAVSSTGRLRSRTISGVGSSNVMARAPKALRGAGIPSPLNWNPSGSAGSTGCRRTKMSRRLFGRSLRHRLYRYEDAAFGFGTELDATIGQREQRVVLAQADILARMPLGTALAGDDIAGQHRLAA